MERRLSCREVTERVWDEKPPSPARLESDKRSCFAGGVAERRVSLPLRVLLSEMDGEGVGRVFDLVSGSRSSSVGWWLLGSNSSGEMTLTGTLR
jgi:hypothetical protein